MAMTQTRHPSVATVVVADDSGLLDATLTAVEQQVYGMDGVVVVGSATSVRAATRGPTVAVSATFAEAVASIGGSVEFLWIVAEGAVPRPDALRAAVQDAGRTEAGIVGSKVLGGDGSLISVGLVTDAFGVPYSGLDRSEVDQGQYDVVRDVAAVSDAALLVRRDLLNGLGGADAKMARLAASVDLGQRARLKGARVVVSPASEVVRDVNAQADVRWREEAGRIRGMLKVYSPLTLVWALPLDFVLGMIEVVVSIFLGRWFGFDFIKSWAWNVVHLPDTVSTRRRSRAGRVAGDEELFRFQRRGSVKLSNLSSASMRALRSRLPGDDRFTVQALSNEMRQPAFVVGVLAVLFVLLSSRNLWSGGFPAVGYTLPFPINGADVLNAYAGGWNPAGFGSAEPLRPLLGIAGLAKIVTFNAAALPEYVLGAGAMLAGIWGMMRLLRSWSISAAPGLIAGVVYVAGPAAQGIAGNTHIGTLLGLGVLPWALRLVVKPVADGAWPFLSRIASVVLVFGLLGAFAPLLLLVPGPVIFIYALLRFTDSDAWRGFILTLFGTAFGALLLSPWIWSASFLGIAREGYAYWNVSSIFAVAAAAVIVAAVVAGGRSLGLVASWGALIAGVGLLGSRSGDFGFGTEFESASLAVVSLGVAVSIGVISQAVGDPTRGGWRRFVTGAGAVGVLLLVVASLTIVLGGRVGLPGDRFESDFRFTLAVEGEAEISRILVVGPPELLPGDSRRIEGGAYRVVSSPVPDLGEARLADALDLDDLLSEKIGLVISGDTKRAGGELAVFGIRWIVVMGSTRGSEALEASVAWRDAFAGQLDLLPLTAAIENTVWVTDVNPVSRALTTAGTPWPRVGWTYEGEPEPGRNVFVAENPDDGWGPGPRRTTESMNELAADEGRATYAPNEGARTQAMAVLVAIVLLSAVAMWGRRRT